MDETKNNKNAPAAESKPPKFPLARLRQDCLEIFGVTTSTFDGAMFGKSGDFTVDEAKKIITDWQKKGINPNGKKNKRQEDK